MSTTLLEAEVLLSKELGDYWTSTTTSSGATDKTTLVDTALKVKHDDWITDGAYDMITSLLADEEERKILSLDNDTGTLTLFAHGYQILTNTTYRIHRLWTASEKRLALIDAAKRVCPHIFTEVRDESMVSGNWLKDGSFEIWSDATTPTYWLASTTVATKTTSSPYFKHGKTSAKLSTAGYRYQSISEWDDLKRLAGKTVTFTLQGYCATADTLRIAIYDGTTTTYSSYRTAESAWTEDNDPLSVTATIQDNPTAIQFRIYLDTANDAYVDDARVFGVDGARIYIGDLGLVKNEPHQVLRERDYYSNAEPWALIHGITYDRTNGYMYLPNYISNDYRLRILGVKYLDFADTDGVTGTDWDDDSIDIDAPQTEILVAQAIIYLCNQKIIPNDETGESQRWLQAKSDWKRELADRKAKFGMETPGATKDWGA